MLGTKAWRCEQNRMTYPRKCSLRLRGSTNLIKVKMQHKYTQTDLTHAFVIVERRLSTLENENDSCTSLRPSLRSRIFDLIGAK